MTGTQVSVTGDRELAAGLHRAADRLEAMPDAHRRVSALIAAAAHPPRQSGALARSIRPDWDAAHAGIASELAYAGVIEYGWPRRGIAAARYAARAVESTAAARDAIYQQELGRIMAEAGD